MPRRKSLSEVRMLLAVAAALPDTISRKIFRLPTTSFLKAYGSTIAIDGGSNTDSHDPTRARRRRRRRAFRRNRHAFERLPFAL
jgi:hypothetical protein